MKNILLLGSGGREHALAWKMAQSSNLKKLFIAPGNAGTRLCGENIPLNLSDFEEIKKFSLAHNIHIVVIGSEELLAAGLGDFFASDTDLAHIAFIGPQKKGAMLESSKDFAKTFMQRHNIPTAEYQTFTHKTLSEGIQFLKTLQPPYVLKADGLAAGKGVVIVPTLDKAETELRAMLDGKFGEAGAKVVIEEFLDGIELSVFILTDGKNYLLLPEAKDYKRIGEGDTGANTGGMGSISPVPFADEIFMQKIENQIIKPTLQGLQCENIPYTGFMFFGLINVKGNPYVIEYNVRMGDPETETVIPRIESDLVELFLATVQGNISTTKINISPKVATCVMLVSGGYPDAFQKGKAMIGIDGKKSDVLLFHAGTALKNGEVVTAGGRVMAVTALASNMEQALEKCYQTAASIQYEGVYFRKDIGKDLLK